MSHRKGAPRTKGRHNEKGINGVFAESARVIQRTMRIKRFLQCTSSDQRTPSTLDQRQFTTLGRHSVVRSSVLGVAR